MNKSEIKRKELEDRLLRFSIDVIKKLQKHSKTFIYRPLIIQVVRSSTSIGANYAEANNASSRADFKNKLFIAKKEAAETIYWLKVFTELIVGEDFSDLSNEALEINMILQSAISTMKRQDNNDK